MKKNFPNTNYWNIIKTPDLNREKLAGENELN